MPHERAPEATVLLVNHTSLQSGAELSLLELIDELPASINQVVACPEGPLADAVRERGVEVRLIPELTGSLRIHQKHTPQAVVELARCSAALRRHAKDVGCELVHANSVRAGLAAAIGLHRSGPPVVVFTTTACPSSA